VCAPPKKAFRLARHDHLTVRRHTLATALAALLAAAALNACGGDEGAGNPDSELTLEQATAQLEGAPPQLAAIRAQANQVLDEGAEGFEARLAELEGTPVVVNKWASWCGPCRLEFPWFQKQAASRAKEVAFLGVGANDSEAALETFLEELPLPYPTYYDPDFEIAKELGGPTKVLPATAFYDRKGELVYTHAGVYENEQELAADIDRYAR
jgi:thiol-disulfide isomerase/thioredoxin